MTRKDSLEKQAALICPCVFMCEKNINFAHVRMYM